jgi:hypothetical protein
VSIQLFVVPLTGVAENVVKEGEQLLEHRVGIS